MRWSKRESLRIADQPQESLLGAEGRILRTTGHEQLDREADGQHRPGLVQGPGGKRRPVPARRGAAAPPAWSSRVVS